jgi:FkbH-like protein
MEPFSQLKKKLKNDFGSFEKIRVAVLGDTTTQLLVQAIRATGYDHGLDLQIWDAEFNQIERQVFDARSELYAHDPQVMVLFHSTNRLLGQYDRLRPAEQTTLADLRLAEIASLVASIEAHSGAKIIYYSYPEVDDAVFGQAASKTRNSFLFQLRQLNFHLMEFAAAHANFYLQDLNKVQTGLGRAGFFQPSLYVNAGMALSPEALPAVAAGTVALIGTFYGRIKKCLVLDLDNVLWGGIIGDDGIGNIQLGSLGIGKVFTEFQYWVKKLKDRGIILAVCSKNSEPLAREPFLDHPDMILRLEDFAVFIANWETKVGNIRRIQAILNIGLDSMVFLDDSPFERNMVREAMPAVTVPELPEDPADYLEYLYSLELFGTGPVTAEDQERTRQYQQQAQRQLAIGHYENEKDFLKGLGMLSRMESFNSFNIPRVAQLTQRSNQFNLRTVRYTEADIERISASSAYHGFSFTLEDKFGDNGIICVVVLQEEGAETFFIESWLMSCRVLKRGMEEFVLNALVGYTKTLGFRYLKGEYLETAKNALVKDHYRLLGFQASGDHWLLDTRTYIPKTLYIQWKDLK